MSSIFPMFRASLFGTILLALAGCSNTVSEGEFGLQSDGSFTLTEAEKLEECGAVHQKMRRMSDETVALDLQSSQEVASSVMWGVLFGVAGAATYRMASDAGEAGKRAKRNRAQLAAYNDNLRARGCQTWDYEAHMDNKQAAIRAKYAEQRRKNADNIR
ncbi:MAG: hypothetical protein AAGI06_03335 [Pseudomonadota bacterium]